MTYLRTYRSTGHRRQATNRAGTGTGPGRRGQGAWRARQGSALCAPCRPFTALTAHCAPTQSLHAHSGRSPCTAPAPAPALALAHWHGSLARRVLTVDSQERRSGGCIRKPVQDTRGRHGHEPTPTSPRPRSPQLHGCGPGCLARRLGVGAGRCVGGQHGGSSTASTAAGRLMIDDRARSSLVPRPSVLGPCPLERGACSSDVDASRSRDPGD